MTDSIACLRENRGSRKGTSASVYPCLHVFRTRLPPSTAGCSASRALLCCGLGDERPKPNGVRLPEFRESSRPSLELRLFSEEPIYDDFEELTLADSLTDFAGQFGASDPTVQQVLAGKSPRDRAVELVTGTKLRDVAVRKKLYEGGAAALKDFSDPMLDLARLVDPALAGAPQALRRAG